MINIKRVEPVKRRELIISDGVIGATVLLAPKSLRRLLVQRGRQALQAIAESCFSYCIANCRAVQFAILCETVFLIKRIVI